MPTQAEKLLKMGAGSREESGLGNRKQNEEEFMKVVGGPEELPKATPPQHVDKIHPGAKYGDKPPEKRINVDQYIKPLGSFKTGTDYVPKTGPYQLHEGEKVTPAKDNMADIMDMVPGRKAKTPKKEHVATHITHHKDGSHTAVHKHSHPEHHPDETHALSNMDALHDHLEQHVGQPNSGEAEAEAGNPEAYTGPSAGAPAPAAGAAPAAAGAPPAVPAA